MVVLVGLAAVLLMWLTVMPLTVLLMTSFHHVGTYGLASGEFTLDNFIKLFMQDDLPVLLGNTSVYVGGTIGLTTILASIWAWITERTDFKYKTTTRVLMMTVMGLPPIIQGFGWTLLLNPNNGYFNHLLRQFFNLESNYGPVNIYSMGMMVFISAFLLTPTVYLMLSGVIRNLDYKLEFPAILAGVHPMRRLMHIIMPILLPGLLSVVIYTVMIMIQVFDIPLTIGLTAGIHVLSTRIFLLSTADLGVPNYNLAAAFGVFLVIIAVGFMILYRHLTRMAEKFSVISGKNYRHVMTPLGLKRFGVYLYSSVFFLMALAPVLILAWASLLPFYRLPSIGALQAISLNNYWRLFDSQVFQTSFGNTVIVVLVGSTITVAFSLLVAYVALRTKGVVGQLVDVFAFLPIAIPHVVLGLAVLLLYVRTPIYGSIAVIIMAQVSVNLVFGVRSISSTLIQVHPDLERAAAICGTGRLKTIWLVLIPILRPSLINGWLFIFAHAMRDLAIPLIFLTSKTMVLSSALWMLWGYPNIPSGAALSMVLVGILVVLVVPIQIYASRLDAKAQG